MAESNVSEGTVAKRGVFADPLPALRRAAERARETARRTNTPLVIARDGQIIHVMPDGQEVRM